eukprot:scaffold190775_cov31-Tisochrysis_lutea.AAC.1
MSGEVHCQLKRSQARSGQTRRCTHRRREFEPLEVVHHLGSPRDLLARSLPQRARVALQDARVLLADLSRLLESQLLNNIRVGADNIAWRVEVGEDSACVPLGRLHRLVLRLVALAEGGPHLAGRLAVGVSAQQALHLLGQGERGKLHVGSGPATHAHAPRAADRASRVHAHVEALGEAEGGGNEQSLHGCSSLSGTRGDSLNSSKRRE